MAYCMNCGQQLPDGAKYCANCGTATGTVKTGDMQRRVVYEGVIHKCPNCGECLDSFISICPTCGYELRSINGTSVVKELSKKLEATYSIEQKKELIRNFYIPNTKEDIHEFFVLALSQVKIGGINTDAWMVKLEQAYQKAELSFPGTQEFDHLKFLYEKAQKIHKRNFVQNFLGSIGKHFRSGYMWALLLFGIGILFHLINLVFNASRLQELADGFRALALLVAAITLFGRMWKSLRKWISTFK